MKKQNFIEPDSSFKMVADIYKKVGNDFKVLNSSFKDMEGSKQVPSSLHIANMFNYNSLVSGSNDEVAKILIGVG